MSDVAWTSVPCMLCGADDPRLLVVDTVRAGGETYRFQVVRCRACGFDYVTPRGTGAVFGNLAGGAARRPMTSLDIDVRGSWFPAISRQPHP